MKRAAILQFPEGSAERVIAHARWQSSRGRRPSMRFLTEANPAKAIMNAHDILRSLRAERARCLVIELLGPMIAKAKPWYEMKPEELEVAVRSIIQSSSSEEEVRERMRSELGYDTEDMEFSSTLPTDTLGIEARELVQALGGCVMRNGAMVMACVWDGEGNRIQI